MARDSFYKYFYACNKKKQQHLDDYDYWIIDCNGLPLRNDILRGNENLSGWLANKRCEKRKNKLKSDKVKSF